MRKRPKPIFEVVGPFAVRWVNFKEYMRDLKEVKAQAQWDKIFNARRQKEKGR